MFFYFILLEQPKAGRGKNQKLGVKEGAKETPFFGYFWGSGAECQA